MIGGSKGFLDDGVMEVRMRGHRFFGRKKILGKLSCDWDPCLCGFVAFALTDRFQKYQPSIHKYSIQILKIWV